ncbi:phospholipase A2 inhibitor and Ly6/PLAUR domain-containing protein-like [Engystomops pustulosus]|uniref:phospholipase A2 inhibitor and Ly6/PLAUR domain-containing protein-like n=1 Tax=Engystomops pustulosus TaxID=76066 RepID=UPI003AFB3ABC
MGHLLGYLLIISALTVTGLSLSCTKCIDFNGAQCTGSSETCSSGSSCATALSVTTVGSSNQSLTLSRGCAPVNQCNITGSLTFQGGYVRISTTCCNSDSCSSTSPTLPATSSQGNGLTCRTCSTDTTDYCYTGDTLQCHGDETMCGRLSTSLTGSATVTNAIRGCATPSVCNILGTQQSTYGSLNVVVKTYCSSGCIGLQESFYLSTLMMLFLIKVLL